MNNHKTILAERIIFAPSHRVWKAITSIDELRQWSMPFPEFQPIRGFEFRFGLGPPGGKIYTHECKVLEVIPRRKLAFSWRYDGYPGDSVVTYRLTPMGPQTLVQISHEGIETFPAEFDREDFETGWNSTIDSLQAFAEPEQILNHKS